jgi:hypothetical protein
MPSVLEEKDAIRELMARYCFHFDNGEFEAWLDLFTDDGSFDLGARGQFAGRDALRTFLAIVPRVDGKPPMKHFVANPIICVDGDRATAQSYVLVVSGGAHPSITLAGRYEDEVHKLGTVWRFRRRIVRFDLMAAT